MFSIRQIVRASAFCVAGLMSVGLDAQPATEDNGARVANQRGVRAVANAIIAADNAQDLKVVIELYTPDAVLMPPNEQAVVGRNAIRPRYEALFRSFTPAITSELDEINVVGEWAFIRGRNRGSLRPLTGEGPPRALNDVFLMILHREADGQWRIARLMWHAGAAPAH